MRSNPEGEAGALELESLSVDEALRRVAATPEGLTGANAEDRLRKRAASARSTKDRPIWLEFLGQFKSPILLLLIFAAILSGILGEPVDAVTIMATIAISSVLSFYQEHQANAAVKELLKQVETQYTVRRDGESVQLPLAALVSGDVVELSTGSAVPGDGKLLESNSMLVNESSLTGESAPVEKLPGHSGKEGVLFAGTHVESGSGRMLILALGTDTAFGQVAEHLRAARPEPQFHKGIRIYGYMLLQFTLLLSLAVFAVNVWLHKPLAESFLFSLALAVGLTPQLLPAIMSVTLARGAHELAREKVIVKRLEAIEDFGSMNVLCSDKTGTLTEGTMEVVGGRTPEGAPSTAVLDLARLNALGAVAFRNPIDEALIEGLSKPADDQGKIVGTIAYDFHRRCQSVLISDGEGFLLITKGAVDSILPLCSTGRSEATAKAFEAWSAEGVRVLAVATRRFAEKPPLSPELEEGLELAGLVGFEDPLRPDSAKTVRDLRDRGVSLKLITGDNRFVAAHVAAKIGLSAEEVATGADLGSKSVKALARIVEKVAVFAEVDPVQKERLILAMRHAGFVVGYIGDGINDGPALHAADVGISVASAVDVAREAADLVMLERGLSVICGGVHEGRRIFANTLKYVFITTSANFGNMFSMAVASAFLPFLPLLPSQILLNNFLTDIPAMAIAGDNVDEEIVKSPRRWNVSSVRKFMIVFGLHSSAFDMLVFLVLIRFLRAAPAEFRTGWFVESAISELLILVVIRTRKFFLRSRLGLPLLIASVTVAIGVLALPFVPGVSALGFTPLPLSFVGALTAILAAYALTAEVLKRRCFGRAYPL